MSPSKKDAIITILTNFLLQIVTAVCGFILPPMIVRKFGSEINGMVSSISQFISYINIVEAGIGAASIAALYKPFAEKDYKSISRIMSATKKFYYRSGIFFVGGIIILALVYPFVVGAQIDRIQSALMVLVLGISGASEFFLIGKYRVLLTADKKVYIISLVQTLAVILNTIVSVLMLKLNASILIVKLMSSLVYLSRFFVLSVYVRMNYRNVSYKDIPDVKSVSQSKNALVHQITGLIVFNSPIIVLTIFSDLKSVSIFSVYNIVFLAINNMMSVFSNGMQSFFGEILVKNNKQRTNRIFVLYEYVYYTVMGWVYSCVVLLIIPFMQVYTKGMTDANYIQPLLALMFVIVGLANNSRAPSNILITAAGYFKKTQNRAIIEGIINVVASIVFTLIWGLYGVLLGAICSYSYRMFDIIIYANKKILNRNFLKSISLLVLVFVSYTIMVLLVKNITISIENFTQWLLQALIYGTLLMVPVIFLSLLYLLYKKIRRL